MDKELLEKRVMNILEQVRPYLQADGGDVSFVELTGACGSCPYSTMTLKNGIETVMKKSIPEIKAVEQIQ